MQAGYASSLELSEDESKQRNRAMHSQGTVSLHILSGTGHLQSAKPAAHREIFKRSRYVREIKAFKGMVFVKIQTLCYSNVILIKVVVWK